MARFVVTKAFTIPASGYNQPARTVPAGAVLELSAAEQAAITGAGGTFRATTTRDQYGLGAGVSNSN